MASGTINLFSFILFKDALHTSQILFFIYLFPWVMILLLGFSNNYALKTHLVEIILMVAIIILGICNTSLSNNVYSSYLVMKLFMLSGIIPLWISMLVLVNETDKNIFSVFSCIWLLMVILVEIVHYFVIGQDRIFLNHPIPLGSLVILLWLGPLVLWEYSSVRRKIFAIILIISSFTIVIISNRRGTYLAAGSMVLAWIAYRYMKSIKHLLLIVVIIIIGCYGAVKYYSKLDKNIPYHNSIMQRIELYPFAFHVFLKYPFFGTGLRAYDHGKYLSDYIMKNNSLDTFGDTLNKLQTFENMALTGFVELGAIMTLLYLILISYIIINYCRKIHPFDRHNEDKFILLLPLLGLAIHSLTYDSLMFPQINWLFHVQLGMLSGLASRPGQ
jgi:hypothetical protein